MDFKQTDNGKKGKFYIELEGIEEAQMTYTYAGPHKIIIDHTEVNENIQGQGVGYKLVEFAVQFMREKGIKAIPLCPFANVVFKKKKEIYSDVLA
ncbi:hypothetical protein OE09_1726 [Flavobacteriaceae bacterium MAR_2010_72]|nr:hypothetical protein OE09_1726 [Flavobacteriaceae bacterium MAR_2010_72]TVZ59555.1 hypothetical protein NA63_2090 [Flavobacteriaceae bacterium MAR_2010_105]